MKLNFEWKPKTYQYSAEFSLYLNRINVGYSNWNSMMSRDDPQKDLKQYVGETIFAEKRFYGATDEEVRKQVEDYVTAWFNEALKGSDINKDGIKNGS